MGEPFRVVWAQTLNDLLGVVPAFAGTTSCLRRMLRRLSRVLITVIALSCSVSSQRTEFGKNDEGIEDVNMVPEKRSDHHAKASFYVKKLSYV